MFSTSLTSFTRSFKRLPTVIPRNLTDAKFLTIDKKNCTLSWKNYSQIDITLQDRATTVVFPIRLRRDAGKIITCVREGGITSLADTQNPGIELRVGFDRGILYFAARNEEGSISTGLAPSEASLAIVLIQQAERKRVYRSL